MYTKSAPQDSDCSDAQIRKKMEQAEAVNLRDLIDERLSQKLRDSINQVEVEEFDINTRISLSDVDSKIRLHFNLRAILSKRQALAMSVCILLIVATVSQSMVSRLVDVPEYLSLLVALLG